jgi:hypothetical protein
MAQLPEALSSQDNRVLVRTTFLRSNISFRVHYSHLKICSGKTVFLLYLLVVRILQKKPTLLRLADNQLIGFSDNGLRLHSLDFPTRDPIWDYPQGTWALTDPAYTISGSSGEPSGPLLTNTNLFVVFTSSLKATQHHEWVRQTGSPMIVMKPPLEEDIRAYR